MPVLKVFELHTYREGVWRIDSVYDDRELALMEADRVGRAGRYNAVRVIEETFNEETDQSTVRTVYRSNRPDKGTPQPAAKTETGPIHGKPPKTPTKKAKTVTRQLVMATLTLASIIGGGLVLLYFVNTL